MNHNEPSLSETDSVTLGRARRICGVLLSLVLPGSGHVLLGKWKRAIPWYLSYALALALSPFSIWPMFAWLVVIRIGAAIDVGLRASDGNAMPRWQWVFGGWIALIVATQTLSWTCRVFYLEAFKIPAESMAPTLLVGDHIFVKKYDKDLAKGDVVVFVYPCDTGKDFVKRVVALEGDTVEVRCSHLYVNGTSAKREAIEDFSFDTEGHEQTYSRYKERLGARFYEVLSTATLEPVQEDFPGEAAPSCAQAVPYLEVPTQGIGEIESLDSEPTGQCEPWRHYVVPKGHFFVIGDNRSHSSDSRVWGAVPLENLKGTAAYIWWSDGPQSLRMQRIGMDIH